VFFTRWGTSIRDETGYTAATCTTSPLNWNNEFPITNAFDVYTTEILNGENIIGVNRVDFKQTSGPTVYGYQDTCITAQSSSTWEQTIAISSLALTIPISFYFGITDTTSGEK